jgi:cytochrome c oxidase subunit 1
MLSDRLGRWQFWLMFLGFNLTFGPFHILGLQGMPRRIYRYPSGRGWDFWNAIATVGSFVIAVSVLLFMWNVWKSRKGPQVGDDPWDARTLEWQTSSPPPEYNFEEIPIVTSRDAAWHHKYTEDEDGRPVPRDPALIPGYEPSPVAAHEATGDIAEMDEPSTNGESNGEVDAAEDDHDEHDEHEEHEEHHIHMPSPSYYPLLASIGLPIICYGLMYKRWWVSVLGGLLTLASIYGWALEPATAPEEPTEETASAEPSPDEPAADEPEPDPEPEPEPAPTG